MGVAHSNLRRWRTQYGKKGELVFPGNGKQKLTPQGYETRIEAQRDIFEYIEIFYNRERLHSFLEYHSPEEYEKMTMVA